MKKCERCEKDVKHRVTCKPNFEAPPLDVCEDCADILLRYEDYSSDEGEE